MSPSVSSPSPSSSSDSAALDEQLDELFHFLTLTDNIQVRLVAAQHVNSLNLDPSAFTEKRLLQLMQLLRDKEKVVAHEAISALINLTAHIHQQQQAATAADMDHIFKTLNNDQFLSDLLLLIVLPNSVLSDLCCMLLSNLTKSQHIIKKLIPADLPSSSTSLIEVRTKHLDNLLEVFVRGATPHASSSPSNRASDAMENTTNKTKNQDGEEEEEEEEDESGTTTTTGPLPKSAYNKHANFHFLASVFANVSATPGGAQFLLGSSTVDGAPRLDRLVIFLNHTDLIRRGGVVSVFKNVCFDVEAHPRLLGDGGSGEEKKKAEEVGGEKTTTTTTSSTTATGILSYLLLPLMGPEEYDDEDTDILLPDLQFQPETKRREASPQLRQTLVESLLLLCTTRRGRDALRAAGTYPILQKLHLWEFNDDVKEAVERVVDLLQRDEEKKKENSTNNVGNSVNALPCSRRIEEVSSDEEDEQGEEEEEGQIDIDEII